ncbi:sigma factor-like helix-turn-helix DNA-binding protein [Streptomyces sp. NPDC050416]|uniref:sigma factor-like helix-turn-helix DNA-binding protein n=1 Tax=Streptomyces sp. NPDC050416 TaxID=3365611 RepID=UPI00378A3CC7
MRSPSRSSSACWSTSSGSGSVRAGSGGAADLEEGCGVDDAPVLVAGCLQGHLTGWTVGGCAGGAVGVARLELDGVSVAGGHALSPQQQETLNSPGAWLTTVASRICLDLLGSARARRGRYVGEWIPVPLPDRTERISGRPGAGTVDPADRVTPDESVNMAFLVVLEAMTPAERVAFILHDVFRYPFAEVAEIVGRTPAACRQLASSARRRIRASQPDAASGTQRADIVRAFKHSWEAKDVNGQPGLVAQLDGVTVSVMAFDVTGNRIHHIWAVLSPDKLRSCPHEMTDERSLVKSLGNSCGWVVGHGRRILPLND